MKRIFYALAACTLAAGCSSASDESGTSILSQDLDISSTQNLTKMQGATLKALVNERDRQADTVEYYRAVHVLPNGTGNVVQGAFPNLNSFKRSYGFDTGIETAVTYYNRGDLGIGREMHCVDKSTSTGEVACYVKNFAAGDDNSEFTFGLSSNIAFTNAVRGNFFATVAMVFRQNTPDTGNRVFFAVYNNLGTQGGDLQNAAALDRVGIQFANAFAPGGNNPPNLGTPGVNFNNHIPSNCISCHGGQHYPDTTLGRPQNEVGSLFLPFDLDQFEFQSPAGPTAAEKDAFRRLNQMVRNVARLANTDPSGLKPDLNSSLQNQIDGWYGNTSHLPTINGDFNSNYLPSGWDPSHGATAGAPALYRAVIRGSCRNCHTTNDLVHFDTEAEFNANQARAVADLCSFAMPHALQSVRLFWQSTQPAALEKYLRGVGDNANADRLHACGPGNVATLDPHLIAASQGAL